MHKLEASDADGMKHPRGRTVLTSLPIELTRRIAVRCPGRSLIALAATCRSVRSACNDALVFRDAIFTRLRDESIDGEHRAQKQIDALSARAGRDVSIWARYAVAVDKAERLPTDFQQLSLDIPPSDPQVLDRMLQSVLSFVPQILAIGYTRATRGNLAQLLASLALFRDGWGAPAFPDGYDADTVLKLAFYFASEAAGEAPFSPSVASAQHGMHAATLFGALRTTLLCNMLVPSMGDEPLLSFGSHRAYFLVGLFVRSLRAKGLAGPCLRSIPLLSHETTPHLPLPFADGGQDGWRHWFQVRSALTVEQLGLEDAEWCGYVSNDPYLLAFSKPLEGIRLQVRHETGDPVSFVNGTGDEGARCFTLEGRLSNTDGRVALVQDYPGWHRSHWYGTITLFGIVGYWTQEMVDRPCGYFLIWNKSWM